MFSLFSPPERPAYNGSIEAAIGPMKTGTEPLASMAGHPRIWTNDMVEAAGLASIFQRWVTKPEVRKKMPKREMAALAVGIIGGLCAAWAFVTSFLMLFCRKRELHLHFACWGLLVFFPSHLTEAGRIVRKHCIAAYLGFFVCLAIILCLLLL